MVLALILLQQWSKADCLGKTPEQVVKMGHQAFSDAYSVKYGSSTAAMCDAETLFGDALHITNNKLAKKLPASKRAWYDALRKGCRDLMSSAVDSGYALSGGGTIWAIIGAGVYPKTEEMIHDSLTKKPLPGVRIRSLESRYAELDQVIKDHASEMTPESLSAAKKAVIEFKKRQLRLTALSKKGSADDQTRVLLHIHWIFDLAMAKDQI